MEDSMNKRQHEILKTALNQLIKLEKELGQPLIYNLGYREVLQAQEVSPFFEDFKRIKGAGGADAKAKGYPKIEAKSKKSKIMSRTDKYNWKIGFEFDKQNDKIRRDQTLQYDAFYFTVFSGDNEMPLVTAIAKNDDSIKSVKNVLKEEQKKFVKRLAEVTKKGKRISRDSVKIQLKQLFDINELIWVIDQKQVTLSEVQKLFGYKNLTTKQ
tara:strand:- start:205 stop:840 length:636 start_codon:yes stop_codon:yes gene_type:complete